MPEKKLGKDVIWEVIFLFAAVFTSSSSTGSEGLTDCFILGAFPVFILPLQHPVVLHLWCFILPHFGGEEVENTFCLVANTSLSIT